MVDPLVRRVTFVTAAEFYTHPYRTTELLLPSPASVFTAALQQVTPPASARRRRVVVAAAAARALRRLERPSHVCPSLTPLEPSAHAAPQPSGSVRHALSLARSLPQQVRDVLRLPGRRRLARAPTSSYPRGPCAPGLYPRLWSAGSSLRATFPPVSGPSGHATGWVLISRLPVGVWASAGGCWGH